MKYNTGQIVEGVITGIKPYGAFVQIDKDHNGLLHISEISDDYIRDINEYVEMREKIKVKIIDKGDDDHHYKLSLKALKNGNRKHYGYTYAELPKMKKGFKTLAENLDIWIKKAMEDEND